MDPCSSLTETKSSRKESSFLAEMPLIKSVVAANRQSPAMPQKIVPLYHRNTKIRMLLDERDYYWYYYYYYYYYYLKLQLYTCLQIYLMCYSSKNNHTINAATEYGKSNNRDAKYFETNCPPSVQCASQQDCTTPLL